MKRKLLSNLLLALGTVILASVLNVIAYFAAFAVTVMAGGVNVLDTDTAMVDQGYFNVIRYTILIVICGFVYYWAFYRKENEEVSERRASVITSLHFVIRPLTIFIVLLAGLSIQITTDSILYILGESFPTTFASYKHMMETFTGSKSALFIFTAIALGPIAEEIIFRGLAMRYSLRAFDGIKKAPLLAIVVQALLFGIYHGNFIQATYAFIFGLLLGAIAIKTNSLIPSIFLHMAINGTLYLIPDKLFLNIPISICIGLVSLAFMIAAIMLLFITYKNFATQSEESDS